MAEAADREASERHANATPTSWRATDACCGGKSMANQLRMSYTMRYSDGTATSVSTVAKTRPAEMDTPIGIRNFAWKLRSRSSEAMPSTVVIEVRRIGRSRPLPPSMAASKVSSPASTRRLMNETQEVGQVGNGATLSSLKKASTQRRDE